MEWLKSFYDSDAFWCIVGILGGAIVTAIFFVLGKSKKIMSYYMVSTDLITQEVAKVPGIQILMNNQPVDNLISTTIKFWNTGNQPITFENFAKKVPFGIKLSNGTFFPSEQSISLTQSNPNSLITLNYVNNSEVHINIEFLNPKDGFSITILHDGIWNEKPVIGDLIGGYIIPASEDLSPFYGSKFDLFLYYSDKYLIPSNFKLRDSFKRALGFGDNERFDEIIRKLKNVMKD